jgi:hypothetical protein
MLWRVLDLSLPLNHHHLASKKIFGAHPHPPLGQSGLRLTPGNWARRQLLLTSRPKREGLELVTAVWNAPTNTFPWTALGRLLLFLYSSPASLSHLHAGSTETYFNDVGAENVIHRPLSGASAYDERPLLAVVSCRASHEPSCGTRSLRINPTELLISSSSLTTSFCLRPPSHANTELGFPCTWKCSSRLWQRRGSTQSPTRPLIYGSRMAISFSEQGRTSSESIEDNFRDIQISSMTCSHCPNRQTEKLSMAATCWISTTRM